MLMIIIFHLHTSLNGGELVPMAAPLLKEPRFMANWIISPSKGEKKKYLEPPPR